MREVVRIHPGWWTPRLFPFVLLASALLGFTVIMSAQAPFGYAAFFLLPATATVVLGVIQRRLCRIVLWSDRIQFPQWRPGDASEFGFTIYLRARVAEDDTDRITTLAARDITDWMREAGRIVLRTRGGSGHAISLSGIRESDRERIVSWLTAKVGG